MPHGNYTTWTSTNESRGVGGQRQNESPSLLNDHHKAQIRSWLQSQKEGRGWDKREKNVILDIIGGLVAFYKKSGREFVEGLRSLLPDDFPPLEATVDLTKAANYVAQNGLEVPRALLDSLDNEINGRTAVAALHNDRQTGHAHFLKVLKRCRSILLQNEDKSSRVTPSAINPSGQCQLALHSVVSEHEHVGERKAQDVEPEESFGHVPPSGLLDPGSAHLSLQELIAETDRTDCIFFLVILNELMGFVSEQFAGLEKAFTWIQEEGLPADGIVEHMMEATVATNFAIHLVAALDEQFVEDHPHLNTVYRVFANVFFVDFTRALHKVVTMKSPIRSTFTEKHAVEWLGDAVECSFRNRSDPHNRIGTIVKEFHNRWQLVDESSTLHVNMQMQQMLVLFHPSRRCR
jgi:hypothetical protein